MDATESSTVLLLELASWPSVMEARRRFTRLAPPIRFANTVRSADESRAAQTTELVSGPVTVVSLAALASRSPSLRLVDQSFTDPTCHTAPTAWAEWLKSI